MKTKKLSQHARLLLELRKHKNGIPNYMFPKMNILSYTKVISDLRAEGNNIISTRVYDHNDKATGVFIYKLIETK